MLLLIGFDALTRATQALTSIPFVPDAARAIDRIRVLVHSTILPEHFLYNLLFSTLIGFPSSQPRFPSPERRANIVGCDLISLSEVGGFIMIGPLLSESGHIDDQPSASEMFQAVMCRCKCISLDFHIMIVQSDNSVMT